jgi:hypothetical protein
MRECVQVVWSNLFLAPFSSTVLTVGGGSYAGFVNLSVEIHRAKFSNNAAAWTFRLLGCNPLGRAVARFVAVPIAGLLGGLAAPLIRLFLLGPRLQGLVAHTDRVASLPGRAEQDTEALVDIERRRSRFFTSLQPRL